MKTPFLRTLHKALFFGLILAGCISCESTIQKCEYTVKTLPLYEQESYLRQSYANGYLTTEHYDQLMASLQSQKRRAETASAQVSLMTPKERAAYLYVLQQSQEAAITRRQFITQQDQVYDATINQRKKSADYRVSHVPVAPPSHLDTPVPFSNPAPPSVAPSAAPVKTSY